MRVDSDDMTPNRDRQRLSGRSREEENSSTRENFPDPSLGRESPQRRRLESHAEVIQSLSRCKRALGKVHLNPQLRAKPQQEVSRPRDLLQGGSKDESVLQIAQDPVPKTMHERGDRGHDTREDLWSG